MTRSRQHRHERSVVLPRAALPRGATRRDATQRPVQFVTATRRQRRLPQHGASHHSAPHCFASHRNVFRFSPAHRTTTQYHATRGPAVPRNALQHIATFAKFTIAAHHIATRCLALQLGTARRVASHHVSVQRNATQRLSKSAPRRRASAAQRDATQRIVHTPHRQCNATNVSIEINNAARCATARRATSRPNATQRLSRSPTLRDASQLDTTPHDATQRFTTQRNIPFHQFKECVSCTCVSSSGYSPR